MQRLSLLIVLSLLFFVNSWMHVVQRFPASRSRSLSTRIFMSTEPNINNEKLNSSPNNSETEGSATTTDGEVIPQEETAQQKYRREKLAEIAEDKAKEVFVTRSTGRYECQACGYVYDETKGLPKKGVAPGTPIDDIDKFRCPQCGASKKYFVAETETLSGFKENLKFGIGTNALTAGQKSLLIYGGLLLGVAVFLSGYLLE
jgi:rubredoxin